MEEYVLNLSRKFWDNYKLFLKEELTLRELEKSITNLSEAVFYQENCNHRFNLAIYAEKHINQNMKQFLGDLFLALKNLSPDSRKKYTEEYDYFLSKWIG